MVAMAVSALCTTVASWGALLTIDNPSFEADPLPNGIEQSSVTDWLTTGDAGVRDPSSSDYGVVNPPFGENIAFAKIGAGPTTASLEQTLTDTLQGYAIYTLSVNVGDRIPTSPLLPAFSASLYAGATLLGSTSTPPPANSGFTNVVVTFGTLATHPALGQPLRIVLSADSGAEGAVVDFDLVTLDYLNLNNPEPSTVALLLLGGAILARRFRK